MKAWPIDPFDYLGVLSKRCQKSYHRDNWPCGSQAFIATLLFDPSMSALPIIVKQNSQALDCSPTNRERELGLDRRETG